MSLEETCVALREAYPLPFELQFCRGSERGEAGRLPALSLLVACAGVAKNGAVAFVLPRKGNVAFAAAALIALTRMRSTFASLIETGVETQLTPGMLVEVLPTGHVYRFGGIDPIGDDDFVRLGVIEPPKKKWPPPKKVLQPTTRLLRVARGSREILRIVPTAKNSPLGKENTPLGEWGDTPLDRLLGIHASANSAIYGTSVLVLAPRNECQSFSSEVRLCRDLEEASIAELRWGRITDEGKIVSEDGSEGQPGIASSHLPERIAAASMQDAVGKVVIIDGARAAVKNFQALDEMGEKHRVIIVAEHQDVDELQALGARGIPLWLARKQEILIGHPTVGDGALPRGVFAEVIEASANQSRARWLTEPVQDRRIDDVARSLSEAQESFRVGDAAGQESQVMSLAYGMLAEAAGWFGAPDATTKLRYMNLAADLERELRSIEMFAPVLAVEALRKARSALLLHAEDPDAGNQRLQTVVAVLRRYTRAGRVVAVAVKNEANAESLRRHLGPLADDVLVCPASLVPRGIGLDAVVVASWPRASVMRMILNLYAAPEVLVVASLHEATWWDALVRTRRSKLTRYRLNDAERSALTGVRWTSVDPVAHSAEGQGAQPAATDLSLHLEQLQVYDRPPRKGRPVGEVADLDRRPARFVGFSGEGFAYLTPGHMLPLVNDLLSQSPNQRSALPVRRADQLQVGDRVLFRGQGDRDVIALFAEHLVGAEKYGRTREIADLWRTALRSVGQTLSGIVQRLRQGGLEREYQTVRAWLNDPDRIAPQSEADLRLILRVGNQSGINSQVDTILKAVSELRSAHIRAGQALSDFLIKELPEKLLRPSDREVQVELTFGRVWVVEVEELGEALEERSYVEVNRLLGVPLRHN